MRRKFGGNERVKKSLLQKLRRDFEVLEMNESEKVEEYFKRVLAISNQMRSNEKAMFETKVVEKILRTLSEKFMYMVVSIEDPMTLKAFRWMNFKPLWWFMKGNSRGLKEVTKETEEKIKS